jgi:hypothetical protein
MTNYAPPATIRERLLSEAVRRHELSSRAVVAVEDLLRHGLSFEQALVGTGLLSSQAFSSWMAEASQLPVLNPVGEERSLPAGLELETVLAWRIIVQKASGKRWVIGLTNPWDLDVRSALEALAVEHGWALDFAYVLPSVADTWLRSADEARRSSEALARYARSLVERVEKEKVLKLVTAAHVTHPRETVAQVPAPWFPALQLRLQRRLRGTPIRVTHEQLPRQSHIELRVEHPQPVLEKEVEHPVQEWTDAFQTFFDAGKTVFVLDERGDVLEKWQDAHVEHATGDWRSGKRWVASPDRERQEELFHLSLAGYPGTICFRSLRDLQDWERAADAAQVAYAACIGQRTNHGIAWSLYTV